MKAIVFTKYGSPDVLELKDVEKPTPEDDEVLVEVHAASVNSWDWELLRGTPFINRLLFGLVKPRINVLGADVAGRVAAVGKNVQQFQPGDEVFGDQSVRWGGFAEYVCAPETALALKPSSMTFEEAASVPQAGLLALQGLRDVGRIRPGQRVLINGAGGGVGTFAVQIAKSVEAEVTGVDTLRKLDMVLAIGADHVIDYGNEDFTQNGQHYDLILDVVGHRSIFDFRRALDPKGIYVMVGGSTARLLQVLLLGLWGSMIGGSKRVRLLAAKPNKDLASLRKLCDIGAVVPVIDRRYPLSQVAQALRYFGEGRATGKVVITMDHP